MMALAMAALAGMLMVMSYASSVPTQAAMVTKLKGQVAATNFLSYRQSVVSYVNVNPGFSGTVPDASLTFQTGYIRNASWTNQVTGGTLYVYSTSAPPSSTFDSLYSMTSQSPMLGIVSGGVSISPAGISVSVPGSIPNGNIVFIGQ